MNVFISTALKTQCVDLSKIEQETVCIVSDDQDQADLQLLDQAPEKPCSSLFMIISKKHDVSLIGRICSGEYYDRVRGFFLYSDISTQQFKDALIAVKEECSCRNKLHSEAADIKRQNAYTTVGDLVCIKEKQNAKNKGEENSTRAFTSLFVDKPMLDLTMAINRALQPVKGKAEQLKNHCKEILEEIRKNKIVDTNGTYIKTVITSLENNPGISIEPMLLTGETGVGKTLIARWIKEQSGLPGTFQQINASGFSTHLLESDLFGHMKGSFTDAKSDKPGKALLAYGGVLFLDEIGDMPLALQPRILKFLEDQCFTPEGWSRTSTLYAPMLIIAATNKNLGTEVSKGNFRQDLYARFRTRLHLPSIAERKSSLHVLIDLLMQQFADEGQEYKNIKYISHSAVARFRELTYEDNFRGLERTVRKAMDETLSLGLDIVLPEVVE